MKFHVRLSDGVAEKCLKRKSCSEGDLYSQHYPTFEQALEQHALRAKAIIEASISEPLSAPSTCTTKIQPVVVEILEPTELYPYVRYAFTNLRAHRASQKEYKLEALSIEALHAIKVNKRNSSRAVRKLTKTYEGLIRTQREQGEPYPYTKAYEEFTSQLSVDYGSTMARDLGPLSLILFPYVLLAEWLDPGDKPKVREAKQFLAPLFRSS